MKIKKVHKTKKKTLVLISGILLLVILLAGGYIAYSSNLFGIRENTQSSNISSEEDNDKEINNPASSNSGNKETDSKESEKESPTNTDQPPTPSLSEDTGKYSVGVTLSVSNSGDSTFLRGGISSKVSDGGECYATLNGPNGQTIRKPTTLLQNPSTTDCKTIEITKNELAKGAWSATLHYSSTTAEGASSARTFEIK